MQGRKGKDMLKKIYGFENYLVVDNGSWTIEQYRDKDVTYTCNILRDGTANVIVETTDKFPKLVESYTVEVA